MTRYTLADLKQQKVALLMGGTSNEREISLLSGNGIYEGLKQAGLTNVHKVDPATYDLTKLKQDGFTVVFNTLHGRFGEDGSVQGLLEVLGLPYTGVSVLSSALTLDKTLTKAVWKNAQVAVAPEVLFYRQEVLDAFGVTEAEWVEFGQERGVLDEVKFAQYLEVVNQRYQAALKAEADYQINPADAKNIIAAKIFARKCAQAVQDFNLPLFVKPNLEGSSLGVTKVKQAADLSAALLKAAFIDEVLLCEKFIDGKEYSVPVLNGRALAAIEIKVAPEFEFYDYQAKYFSDDTVYECPAELSAEATARILKLAEDAARAVQIKSWCRVDVLSDSQGNFYALEVNTNPGMTSHSLFPMGARHVGMSYPELCTTVLLNALNRVEKAK